MYFLQECTQCSALNQITTECWSDSKKRISCQACKKANVFGNLQEEITQSSVELVAGNIGEQLPQQNQAQQNIQIYWECGVCNKASQFASQRVTTKGAKITCNKCFNFILLRSITHTPDIPMAIIETISPPPLPTPQTPPTSKKSIAPKKAIEISPTTRIQKQDIVEVFQHLPDESSKETVIKTGYSDPRATVKTDKPMDPKPIHPISMPDIDEIVSDPAQYQPLSISDQKIDDLFSTPDAKQGVSKPREPSMPKLSQDIRAISNQESHEITHAYKSENSFASYKNFKENATFISYQIDEDELKEIPPHQRTPAALKKLESKMSKYSLIASALLAVLIVIFFFIRQWKLEKLRKKAEAQKQEWILQQKEENKNKPKYGFPTQAP